MKNIIKELRRKDHPHVLGALDIFKYIGPGLLVTVGFIDPGNWASNFAAGSEYGYTLLWVVTLSTIMLIALQHNVAHLGIVTGLCLSEAAVKYSPKWAGRPHCGECDFSQHFDLTCRDIRRCNRVTNALRYKHSNGCSAYNGGHTHYAFHKQL